MNLVCSDKILHFQVNILFPQSDRGTCYNVSVSQDSAGALKLELDLYEENRHQPGPLTRRCLHPLRDQWIDVVNMDATATVVIAVGIRVRVQEHVAVDPAGETKILFGGRFGDRMLHDGTTIRFLRRKRRYREERCNCRHLWLKETDEGTHSRALRRRSVRTGALRER